MITSSSNATRTSSKAAVGDGIQQRGDRHRLFFALMPDSGVRAKLVRAVEDLKAQQHPGGRWIAAERFHITLHFLGDEAELRPVQVARAMAAAKSVRQSGFDLELDTATSFPRARPPWVLRCSKPAAGLQQLWQRLARALAGEQMRSDSSREFIPHVTVLRDADKPLPSCAIDPIAWHARDFALVHSQTGSVNRYTELGRWPLESSP